MPELPDSSAPELSSEDRLAVFLASAAQSGGRLTPAAWDGASDVLASVFAPDDTFMGEARRRAEQRYFTLQTRFHAALLQPAVPLSGFSKDSRLADDVAALPPDSGETVGRAWPLPASAPYRGGKRKAAFALVLEAGYAYAPGKQRMGRDVR